MKRLLFSALLLIPAAQGYTQTCNNLVTNGDFESGGNVPANFGFTTSYIYAVPGANVLVPEGRYTLVGDPNSVHSGFAVGSDHTTGNGRSMVVNGSVNANTIVWQETISVVPNTNYYFSTWVKNVVNGNNAILQFTIGGSQIGSNFTASSFNQWERFFATWNSGSNTSAVIRLVDQQTAAGGNDFAIDDVFFTDVAPLTIASLTPTAASCAGAGDGSLAIAISGGLGPFQYSVNGGPFVSVNPNTVPGLNPGTYSIVVMDACGNLSPAVSATVGAVDQKAPVVSGCPSNMTVFTGPGRTTCDQVANWLVPTAQDNCSSVTVVSNHNPGDTFPIGTTTVSYTFTDASNNSASCSFLVTVIDNTPPTIVCPNNITVNNDPGLCGASVTFATPATSDNCATCGPASLPGFTSLGVFNGHKYFKSNSVNTWAHLDSVATSFGGHLATITSAAEDAFLRSNVTGATWIGLTDQASEGTFRWVTGEPVSYTNWCPGEPNNQGNEDFAVISFCPNGGWNDLPDWVDYDPAIVEFDCSGAVQTGGPASGSVFPVGTTPVSYSVTDASGNVATCSFNVTVVDNEAPVARCKPYTLVLSGGTGTVTAAHIDDGSTDNCGIVSRTVTPNTFSCADAGTTIPVVLSVADAASNTSSCTAMVTVLYKPTCSIAVTACNNTYTGGNPHNIYLGYGPQCANIAVTAGGGGSGFTYSWAGTNLSYLSCTNCANPTFTPTAPGQYTYTVTVTNSSGCSTTCTVNFCVKDVKAPTNGNNTKIYICHAPPGNPGNAHTLSISINGVPGHLGVHPGDYLGQCGQGCDPNTARMTAPQNIGELIMDEDLEMVVYPNPFTSTFHIKIESNAFEHADVIVYDLTGRIVERHPAQGVGVDIVLGEKLTTGVYFVEVRHGELSKKLKITKL